MTVNKFISKITYFSCVFLSYNTDLNYRNINYPDAPRNEFVQISDICITKLRPSVSATEIAASRWKQFLSETENIFWFRNTECFPSAAAQMMP